ncbi:hypothetical protein JCM5350_007231 [Sporobolomyces pararoseus]
MQSLVSYGSDSDESSSPPPVASTSKATLPPNPSLNPLPPVLNRVKSTTTGGGGISHSQSSSKTNSPLVLSGVVSSRSNTPTPRKGGGKTTRESSASPPPHARASAPQSTELRNENDRNGTSSTPLRGDGPLQQHPKGIDQSSSRQDEPRKLSSQEDEEQDAGQEKIRIDLNSLSQFGIPPIPTGPCNPAVEAKLSNFNSLRQSRGLHFNDSLSSSKAFRNPRIYTKLVEFMDVDETGNCWDKSVWNPKEIGRDGTASRIAELQKLRSEAKQAQIGQPNSRSSINFTSATSSTSSTTGTSSKSGGDIQSRYRERDERDRDRDREKKRSRWDNGGGVAGSSSSTRRDRSRSPHSRRR